MRLVICMLELCQQIKNCQSQAGLLQKHLTQKYKMSSSVGKPRIDVFSIIEVYHRRKETSM